MTDLPRPALISRAIAMTMAAAATFVIVAGSAAPATAAPVGTPRIVVVSLSGIDLASPAGEARIADAVARAARSVCTAGDNRALAERQARRTCIATALGTALPQLAARADAARTARFALADASAPTTEVRR